MRNLAFALTVLISGCASNGVARGCSGPEIVQGYSSPLVAAAGNGSLAEVKMLLSRGEDPNAQDCDEFGASGEIQTSYGFTPLMMAIAHGYIDVAQALVASGADPAVRTSDGKTAKDFAAESGREDAVQFMRNLEGK